MICYCPITAAQWQPKGGFSLNLKLEKTHPIFELDLNRLVLSLETWDTLSDEDKKLLWTAILAKSELVQIRYKIQPSANLVESTIRQLSALITWVSCQRLQTERFPGYVPANPSCDNIQLWLSLLQTTKDEFTQRRAVFATEQSELSETLKMDRLLARWQSTYKASSEAIPATFATWILNASDCPLAVAPYWFKILTKENDQLADLPDFRLADLAELIDHMETWQHPTLLRRLVLRQLNSKAAYLRAVILDVDEPEDWLLSNNKKPHDFGNTNATAAEKAKANFELQENLAEAKLSIKEQIALKLANLKAGSKK